MEVLAPQRRHRGRHVRTTWSPEVVILEVLLTIRVSSHIFHGVRAETVDQLWDWVDVESLLWVLDTGTELTLWRDFEARPRISNMDSTHRIEAILGMHESAGSNVYLGVKWRDYGCPTWELEDEIPLLYLAGIPAPVSL